MRKQNIFNIILFIIIIISILILFLEYINISYLEESFSSSTSSTSSRNNRNNVSGSLSVDPSKKKYRCDERKFDPMCDENKKPIYKCLNKETEINNSSEIHAYKRCKDYRKHSSRTMAKLYTKNMACKKKPVNPDEEQQCIEGNVMGYKCINKNDDIKEHPGWEEKMDGSYDFCKDKSCTFKIFGMCIF
tara:strand:+ start:1495 stop:2061 length:567 start_codon:yes stop_codon:yes gene_type:complete